MSSGIPISKPILNSNDIWGGGAVKVSSWVSMQRQTVLEATEWPIQVAKEPQRDYNLSKSTLGTTIPRVPNPREKSVCTTRSDVASDVESGPEPPESGFSAVLQPETKQKPECHKQGALESEGSAN